MNSVKHKKRKDGYILLTLKAVCKYLNVILTEYFNESLTFKCLFK